MEALVISYSTRNRTMQIDFHVNYAGRDIYILLLTSFAFSLMRIFSDRLGSIIVEATMNEKSTVGAAVVSFIVSLIA